MVVCIPVSEDGSVDQRWGRARRVAIVQVSDREIDGWTEHDVEWDALHDAGGEGEHHARIARFVKEQGVDVVVAGHTGPPMAHMLDKMGVAVSLGATGDAREAVVRALPRIPPGV